MTQVSRDAAPTSPPSHASCESLLGAMPAFAAFRRALYQDAPPESRGWLASLGVLARQPASVRPSQLAEMLHVDLSVVSRALAQLETLGYVEREPDPDDRRASRVFVTERGRAWLQAFVDRAATHMQDYLVGWSDDDVDALAAMLHRFRTTLEEHA